jgi:hypothetical protein
MGIGAVQQRFHRATDLMLRRTAASARLLDRSIGAAGADSSDATRLRQRRAPAQLATAPASAQGDAGIEPVLNPNPSRVEIGPMSNHGPVSDLGSAAPVQPSPAVFAGAATDEAMIQRSVAPHELPARPAPMLRADVPVRAAPHGAAGMGPQQRLVLPRAANPNGSDLARVHQTIDTNRSQRSESQLAARGGDGAQTDRTHASDRFEGGFTPPLEGTHAASRLDGSSIPAAAVPTASAAIPSPQMRLLQRKAGSLRGVGIGGPAVEPAPVPPFTLAVRAHATPIARGTAVASSDMHASAPQISSLLLHRGGAPVGHSATIARQAEVGQSTAGATAPAPVPAAAPPAGRTGPDVQQIAEQVARLLARRLEVERERRGIDPWTC